LLLLLLVPASLLLRVYLLLLAVGLGRVLACCVT
jgi:hypothetical protein